MRWIVFVLFLFSCNDHNKIPSEIIKPKEMQSILWDMIRADKMAEEKARRDSFLNLNHENLLLINQVLSIHKVKKSEFDRSLQFYQNNPDMLRSLLDSIKMQEARKKLKDTTGVKKKFEMKNKE
jgi:hypothetical protein